MHLDLTTPQRPELHLDVSTLQGPELLGTYICRLQEPVLLLNLSTLQRPVLTCTRLHYRDLRCTWTWTTGACGLDVSTSHAAELHLDMSTLQRPMLHHVFTTRTWAAHRYVWTTGAFAAPWCVYTLQEPELHLNVHKQTTGACAAPGLVYTTEACADLSAPTLKGPEIHLVLDMSGQQEPAVLVWTCQHHIT
jgi:hypothetical protein